MAFKQDPKDGKYYIKTGKAGKDDYIADSNARYGYSRAIDSPDDETVSYNGLKYLLKDCKNKPFLLQEIDIQVMPERREIRGIKKM